MLQYLGPFCIVFEISKCGKVRTPRGGHFEGNVSKTIVFCCLLRFQLQIIKDNFRRREYRDGVCVCAEEEDNRQQQQHQSLQ